MMNTILDISVVICAYTEERWHNLVDAVNSIKQQSVPPREIIVVVDHNLSLQKRAQADILDVIVIENSEQQGLSGARNSGIALAQGTFVAFLDDDAIAEQDWLIRLHHCFEDPQVLGVGGSIEPRWLDTQPAWFPKEFYWVIGCTYQDPPEVPCVVRNPYGGCTCMRREIFEVVGGFRNDIGRIGKYPLGGEETELSIRAQQHWPQKIFLYQPQAKIHHCVPAQRANWHYFRSRCYAEGLSKAIISKYVGTKDGLSSERVYTLRTLPLGVLRGLANALFHGDPTGLLRAGAIIVGLVVTIAGYLKGCIVLRTFSPKHICNNTSIEQQQSLEIPNNDVSVEQVY